MKILGRMLSVFGGLLVLSLCIFTTVDRTPYQEKPHYSRTMSNLARVDKADVVSIGDTIQIGWARETLLSGDTLPMAGYGARRGAHYEAVHDSIWAKAFVFDNGEEKYAYVTLDMLIVPMDVAALLPDALSGLGFPMEKVFLSATHSHCSIGGWGRGIAGELFAGEYDAEAVQFIAAAMAASVAAADKNKEPAQAGYAKVEAADLVSNRLVGDRGTTDPWFRMLKFVNKSNKTAVLGVFSAHATCLNRRFVQISADYPGALCQKLEERTDIDFAAFSAGAVGSMTHRLDKDLSAWEKVDYYSEQMLNHILPTVQHVPLHYDSLLGAFHTDLHMPEAHFRVSKDIRARPWVFKQLLGLSPSPITSFRIADVLFVGTPCDFSGELVPALEQKAGERGLHLIVTSFNGGYTGYITKDEWYDLKAYETRTMNWFGPYNGAYFSEVIGRVIDIYTE